LLFRRLDGCCWWVRRGLLLLLATSTTGEKENKRDPKNNEIENNTILACLHEFSNILSL